MAGDCKELTRRTLLRTVAGGAIGAGWLVNQGLSAESGEIAATRPAFRKPSQVVLTAGESRADNISRALRMLEPRIKAGLARKKRIVLKPNVVSSNNQLAASHVDCIEAILDFLKPLYKDEVVIAESSASGPAAVGFENYRYLQLANKYNVRFVELDEDPVAIRRMVDHRFFATPVRLSKRMVDPDAYIISSSVMKTHDRAIVTLSLKNVVVGSAIKDKDFHWGPGSKGASDKLLIHGGPRNEGIHYNMFQVAHYLHPHLAIIDGYQGMEGNGPVSGTAVDHKVAVASTDWLAADRVGAELMGFPLEQIGYLLFSTQAGLGQGDLSRIEIQGEKIATHARRYRPHDNIAQQLEWMKRS